AAASCECGYTLNSTTDQNSSYSLFTDLLETDFLHLYTLPDSIGVPVSKQIGWAPQAYNVSPVAARGPYGKSAEVGNVVLNPLNETYDWGGVEGRNGGDPGLQIWVRGVHNTSDWSIPGSDAEGQMVRIGEIDSLRQDVRYGSFRIGMKMATVEGTCAAFFWYRNNTQEIDMEYLSRQAYASNSSGKLNLVIQSPLSAALGYNAAPTQTYTLHDLPFLPDEDYHEYRFDWTPSQIAFWVDGIFLASFNQYDPDAAGTMMLNHWSNGDPNWSGGPPATDTAITISYIKAYFNSTNATRN
ncbi:concanavalin A-like lectin/glucanase domain-containing protein, partial [Delphinella strobiligena]